MAARKTVKKSESVRAIKGKEIRGGDLIAYFCLRESEIPLESQRE